MKRGARHQPDHPALAHAIDYAAVKVGLPQRDTNWFTEWNWQPDGYVLLNDDLSCCCPAADLRLVQAWQAARGVRWRVPVELVRLRYAAVAGYLGTPETDQGTIPAIDCFDWQTAPIVASGLWRVRWCVVPPADVVSALRRGPLLLTIGLTATDADDPDLWGDDPDSAFTDFHRVVCGANDGEVLSCLTYGFLADVAAARVVAADLMLPVDAPAELRTAGVDWSVLG